MNKYILCALIVSANLSVLPAENPTLSTGRVVLPTTPLGELTQKERNEVISKITEKNVPRIQSMLAAQSFPQQPPQWLMEAAQALALPLELLKKHKGNIEAMQCDPELINKQSAVKEAYRNFNRQLQQFNTMIQALKPQIHQGLQNAVKELLNPAYEPLLSSISPIAIETIELIQLLLENIQQLSAEVAKQIKTNQTLRTMFPSRSSKVVKNIFAKRAATFSDH